MHHVTLHMLNSKRARALSHTLTLTRTLSSRPSQPAPHFWASALATMAWMLLIHMSSPVAALPQCPRPLDLLRCTSLAHHRAKSIYWPKVGYWGECPLHTNEWKAAREQTRSKGSLFSFLGCRHKGGRGDVGEEGRSQRQQ